MFATYLRILSFLAPYKPLVGLSVFISLIYSASNILAIPLIRDLAHAVANRSEGYLMAHILNAVICATFYVGSKYAQQYLMSVISFKVIVDMRHGMYTKLLALPMAFYQQWKQGEIIARSSTDLEKMKDTIVENFRDLIPAILTFFGVLSYLFYLNWRLTCMVIVAAPIIVIITQYFGGKVRKNSGNLFNTLATITHIIHETITNIPIIKSFTLEQNQLNRFQKENNQSLFSQVKIIRYILSYQGLIEISQFVLMIFLVWFGSYDVVNGRMTGPELISYFTGLLLLSDPLVRLSAVYTTTQQGLVSGRRVFAILDQKETIENDPNATNTLDMSGDITFEKVAFYYGSIQSKPVIENLNLTIKSGEIVAFVGESGSGKSTLVNLLPRFYDVTSGEITISNTPIKSIDLHNLRSQIGMVTQDSLIFRESVMQNIRYGRLDATDDEVKAAARQANAHEFIQDLPLNYNTVLMDRGISVSGGQRQRLSIARAILKNPKVLILDEATSALDSRSEYLVQEALNRLMDNRTTLVIAHRLSTILHADKIVVLEKGKIVEIGKHDALLEKNGAYANLYKMQFQPVN